MLGTRKALSWLIALFAATKLLRAKRNNHMRIGNYAGNQSGSTSAILPA